ncbi:hypothetical protein Patl1_04405 [Pistacia atlantica]|uniref:Uncharacterized protein n=1 Tax=Pistacia atlantica TaxID=434234 RepID=A0ACC1BX58_9ROSI|nr:hypothetical protein Patl1_04405 [Pistacia atlantica]
MSLQVSALLTSITVAKQDTNRRSANFHPSIWGDHFLSYACNSVESDDTKTLQELKDEIKKMLFSKVNRPIDKLGLIDEIQLLGVSYHFETEIDELLDQIYQLHQDSDSKDDNDTYISILLNFDYLDNMVIEFPVFRDSNGNFKASLMEDIQGLLSFYETTNLRGTEKTILDEALVFTTTHLEPIATELSTPLAAQVKHVLNQPLYRGLTRLEARHYMTIYQEESSHDQVLLTFAKLDYNILQKLHQKELSGIFK